MPSNIYCPGCHENTLTERGLLDGSIAACPNCGHQEFTAGIDVEAQLRALDDIDVELAASWRQTIMGQIRASTH